MKYHLLGIAGSSMSGLAKILSACGEQVTGCDLTQGGHSPAHIVSGLDAVVISAAITPNSEGWIEVEKARKMKIPVFSRSKMIGRLMSEKGRVGIAVAGMHGKTTVSAMIALILKKAGYKPGFLLGGEIKGLGNAQYGEGRYFVAEACEYAKQFLDFRPKVAVITNIEEEHLDTYPGGLPEIRKNFKKFVKLLPPNGLLVLWEDDPTTPWLIKCAPCKTKTFSIKKPWPGLKLKIPGEHNLLNALAAARVCHELGVPSQIIKETLNHFTGVKRRFEIKGEAGGVLVVDDYGHHPTEIKATLKAASSFYPERRIICLFQPHQYSRTKALWLSFAASFAQSDKLILDKIFVVPGRDPGWSVANEKNLMERLVKEIQKRGRPETIYLPQEEKILEYLKKEVRGNDLVITMGATKIYQLGEELLRYLKEREKNGGFSKTTQKKF